MTTHRLAVVALSLALLSGAAYAQEPKPQPEAQPQPAPAGTRVQGARGPVVPLEVLVVISRYQGDKKISTMPYVLAVNANSLASQLNMGAEVPVPATTFLPAAADKAPAPLRSFNYRPIGTNIECGATTSEDGRFEVQLSVDETSVLTTADMPATVPDAPVFRSFKSRNRVLLRDGQSRQYTAATDRVNGETVRIDVTIKVVK